MSPIDNVIDTLLNMSVFAFLGVLAWLYLRPETKDKTARAEESRGPR